jgi:hypothetical protein
MHTFVDQNANDILLIRETAEVWSLVSREKNEWDMVRECIQIEYTNDEIIEFAEKLLELTTREQS